VEGLYVSSRGAWHSNLPKILLIYSISYFNLGGIGALFEGDKPTKEQLHIQTLFVNRNFEVSKNTLKTACLQQQYRQHPLQSFHPKSYSSRAIPHLLDRTYCTACNSKKTSLLILKPAYPLRWSNTTVSQQHKAVTVKFVKKQRVHVHCKAAHAYNLQVLFWIRNAGQYATIMFFWIWNSCIILLYSGASGKLSSTIP